MDDIKLRPEGTPHRVYAVCRLASLEKYSKEQLAKLCMPEKSESQIFKVTYNMCENFGLIRENEKGNVIFCKDKAVLLSHDTFRRFVRDLFFVTYKDSKISRFTQYFMGESLHVSDYSSYKGLTAKLPEQYQDIKEENLLAWRFWLHYMGLCYLFPKGKTEIVIYNPIRCLEDFLLDQYSQEQEIDFEKFYIELNRYCGVFSGMIRQNIVCDSLSLGLYTLEELGVISIRRVNDALIKWRLSSKSTDGIPIEVTSIEIREVE